MNFLMGILWVSFGTSISIQIMKRQNILDNYDSNVKLIHPLEMYQEAKITKAWTNSHNKNTKHGHKVKKSF